MTRYRYTYTVEEPTGAVAAAGSGHLDTADPAGIAPYVLGTLGNLPDGTVARVNVVDNPATGLHRWLGTDTGSECYACGMVLDYHADRSDPDSPADDLRAEDAALRLAPGCTGPHTPRAHHYVLALAPVTGIGARSTIERTLVYRLECAYGDSTVDWDSGDAPRCTTCGRRDHRPGTTDGHRYTADPQPLPDCIGA